jgi:hypothetical protein
MNQIHLQEVKAFMTENDALVTKRIEDGRTTAFAMDEKKQAYALARKTNSYVYLLYCNFKSAVSKKKVLYGYAVPK